MRRLRKFAVYLLSVMTVLAIAGGGLAAWMLYRSLPQQDGETGLTSISGPVTVSADRHGVPLIEATNRLDAMRALGYVSARDRLFQMDLMRRKNAGRLAEIFGRRAVKSDRRSRVYGFSRVAQSAVAKMPAEHRRLLEAYAEGVNGYIEQTAALPFEFIALNYRPEPWKPEDSMLLVLGMYDTLTSGAESQERMLSVMEKTLPAEVLAFLTPGTDSLTDSLHQDNPARPPQPVPVAQLQSMLQRQSQQPGQQLAGLVRLQNAIAGSNAWVVGSSKTSDGRAILANDMHLGISAPNIWHHVEIRYRDTHASGVMLPGLPVLVAGSNGEIAWGATNLGGDFLDLVRLEVNADNPGEYRAGNGWQAFKQIGETISIKGGQPLHLTVYDTQWGPVSEQRLLGQQVAVHWAALDDNIVNLNLLDLDQAGSLQQAISTVNRSGGPQLNILLADRHGHIAWTLMGQIPKRFGNDGAISRSWADGSVGWDGYIEESLMPRIVDPAEGFLVSANDRRLGGNYPYVIGHAFAPGYRAYRITNQLRAMQDAGEQSLFALQLDADGGFYGFYHQLAIKLLSPEAVQSDPELGPIRDYLLAWNGRADAQSLGFALLIRFRERLTDAVFTPFLSSCREADAGFHYFWWYSDTPLQALLTEKAPELLPDSTHYRDWDHFILDQLKYSARQLQAEYPGVPLPELTWGKLNKAKFSHPLSGISALLGALLDMPNDELSGCPICVRATTPKFGASERLVVSPAHMEEGILHMPGGQSGHPLSPHYRDQQPYWVNGWGLPFLSGEPKHRLLLKPVADAALP